MNAPSLLQHLAESVETDITLCNAESILHPPLEVTSSINTHDGAPVAGIHAHSIAVFILMASFKTTAMEYAAKIPTIVSLCKYLCNLLCVSALYVLYKA